MARNFQDSTAESQQSLLARDFPSENAKEHQIFFIVLKFYVNLV